MSVKILVADESPTIHKIVAMAFEEEGITVEGISRGEHVMEYMVEYQPNIVLADIHLPGIDGYELSRQIKNFGSFKGTRVILLTSDFEDIDKLKLEVSQADDFISKPFKTEEILKKVKTQLKLPEPKQTAETTDTEPSQQPENNEVIQNEFEDIINQARESSSDPVQQFFDEDGDFEPSIDEIDLESDTPAERNSEESREDEPQDDSETEEDLPEVLAEPTEEVIRAETRPVKVMADDLDTVFQSVLSSPKSGLEDAPKPEPGTKPNLIEETLTFMARQQIEGEIEITPLAEPSDGETLRHYGNSAGPSLGDKIIKEHMNQVIDRIPEEVRHDSRHADLEKTVREVLGDIAPKIIREVIREEIEVIKKMKEA